MQHCPRLLRDGWESESHTRRAAARYLLHGCYKPGSRQLAPMYPTLTPALSFHTYPSKATLTSSRIVPIKQTRCREVGASARQLLAGDELRQPGESPSILKQCLFIA